VRLFAPHAYWSLAAAEICVIPYVTLLKGFYLVAGRGEAAAVSGQLAPV
jgi:hypothetical protein